MTDLEKAWHSFNANRAPVLDYEDVFSAGWFARVAADTPDIDHLRADSENFRKTIDEFSASVRALREVVENLKPKVQDVTPIAPATPEMFKYPEPVRGVCDCECYRLGTDTKG